MDIEQLATLYPCLYHMTEAGAWPRIQQLGLLSTSAALDLFKIKGDRRRPFESEQRALRMLVPHWSHPEAIVLRDQKLMPPEALLRVLPAHVTPSAWYELLNSRAFFWVSRERLMKLLGAREYRASNHDVLVLDTLALASDHHSRVWLAHMNTGSVIPWYRCRDPSIFLRIEDYALKQSGTPVKPVAELTVDYALTDIEKYTLSVHRVGQGRSELVWRRHGHKAGAAL